MSQTLLQELRNGQVPDRLKDLARKENIDIPVLIKNLLEGTAVVLGYRTGRGTMVVGKGVTTKVNANIGASTLTSSVEHEQEKLRAALRARTDAVMDLSLADNIVEIRKAILSESTVPVGTVPIYEAATMARIKRGAVIRIDVGEFFECIERQMKEGVDFVTVHCGVVRDLIGKFPPEYRLEGIVSRGGAITAAYIRNTGRENPLYQYYDRLVELAEKHDCVLSLGDGMRPGALFDASDSLEIGEQVILGKLQRRAFDKGVMVMIEGPGHVPLHLVEKSVKRIKRLTHNAPLYLLGPIVTDIAPGYDHITSAIGAGVAGMSGADFICYVTPSEHLGLPTGQDVFDGVIAARIAAHASDIAKNIPGAIAWDNELSRARKALDWDKQIDMSIDPETARRIRRERSGEGACTMCGEYCVFLVLKDQKDK